MNTVVPAEEVGAKIVEWYSCIIARSVDQSVLLHSEIKQLIKKMEPNDRILAYYSLVEYRFDMMYDQVTDEQRGEEMLEQVSSAAEESIDHMLRYLYYFVSGQHEFMHERYRSAIRLFRKAERLLEHVNDEAEEADFHYYMGSTLYRISEYTFAASYLEEALVTFNRLKYTERVIYTRVLLGGIYSEAQQFNKATEIFQEAYQDSNQFPVARVISLRALGLNTMRQREYNVAIQYFQNVLEEYGHENTLLIAKTQFNLANLFFKVGRKEEGTIHLKKAELGAKAFNSDEYKARCLVAKGLYLENNSTMINQAVNLLNQHKMFFELDEVALEAFEFFQKRGATEDSVEYLKTAYEAKQNLTNVGVDES